MIQMNLGDRTHRPTHSDKLMLQINSSAVWNTTWDRRDWNVFPAKLQDRSWRRAR